MSNPNEAICHYCGEKLPHEKCVEAKKPDPIEDGCKDCPKMTANEGMCMWGGFVGDCPYNNEARKKPEPTEFTKIQRAAVQMCIDAYETEEWMGAGSVGIQRLLKACDIIDRLTNALQALRDVQNGPPLIRDKQQWEIAMKLADEALREN